jgi:hypothetical protein
MHLALKRCLAVPLLMPLLVTTAVGQVGHAPGSSPFRDIRYGNSITFFYTDFGGDGGSFGVGPHNGPGGGVRFDFRISHPLQAGLSVSYLDLQQAVLSLNDSGATVSKPGKQSVVNFETNLHFTLTGRKTWHGLAPYFGGAAGLAFASGSGGKDAIGYNFGTRVTLAPVLGLRLHLGQRLFLRGEFRQTFWKLKYPTPNTSEWTGGRQVTAGLGFGL